MQPISLPPPDSKDIPTSAMSSQSSPMFRNLLLGNIMKGAEEQPSGFFKLPLEIREIIYEKLLVTRTSTSDNVQDHIHISGGRRGFRWYRPSPRLIVPEIDAQLLRVSRQVYWEALRFLYRSYKFVFIGNHDSASKFLETVGPNARHHITRIEAPMANDQQYLQFNGSSPAVIMFYKQMQDCDALKHIHLKLPNDCYTQRPANDIGNYSASLLRGIQDVQVTRYVDPGRIGTDRRGSDATKEWDAALRETMMQPRVESFPYQSSIAAF